MKKLTSILLALLLSAGFATPTQAETTKWTADQRTLAAYSGSTTTLSSLQKSQIRDTIDTNPFAEKFICTGIRYYDQPMSVNIMVRKRAKEACAYAKELNPELSTWFQNKPTRARSYAGRVLLTVKSPATNPALAAARVDSEQCKIEENSLYRNGALAHPTRPFKGNATAFPFNPTELPIEGEINVAFIHIDWQDLPGSQADYDHYVEQVQYFEDFYWMVSENKLKMNVQITEDWLRADGSYKDVATDWAGEAQRGSGAEKQKFYDVAVAASDPYIDFSDIDIVFFGLPKQGTVFEGGGPHEFGIDYNAWLKTDEGNIYDTATAGDFFKIIESQPEWVYYVHEVGHMIGVPHQANEDENRPGVALEKVMPFGGWDIMSNQGGIQKTISAWLRWLAGWLDDSQVVCLDRESLDETLLVELTEINQVQADTEAVVIKISDSKVIVIESRRESDYFDFPSSASRDGVIVSITDGNLGSAQGNQKIVQPRGEGKLLEVRGEFMGNDLDALLFEGDEVEVAGLRIKNLNSKRNSDLIQITKFSNSFNDEMLNSAMPVSAARVQSSRGGCGCCGCGILTDHR